MFEHVEHDLEGEQGPFRVVVLDHPEGLNPPCAAIYGKITDGCLVRIQSRCLYGEIFESTNCDCQFQLRRSLEEIRRHAGVLIYLDQEGRGAGLHAKAKGYRLSQTHAVDTFAAYAELGYKADSRTYEDAAALLTLLGLGEVTLMTNNPAKVEALEIAGFKVVQQALVIPKPGDQARAYLAAKEHQGHFLVSGARFPRFGRSK